MLNEPKVAYRNKLLLVWLPTCLGISYSIALHFSFRVSCALPPPKKKSGGASLYWFCLYAPRILVTPLSCLGGHGSRRRRQLICLHRPTSSRQNTRARTHAHRSRCVGDLEEHCMSGSAGDWSGQISIHGRSTISSLSARRLQRFLYLRTI